MDAVIAGFKFPHHSPSSGYQQLQKYIDCDYYDANKLPFGTSKMTGGSYLRDINLLLFEFQLTVKIHNYDLVHYIYPENHLMFSNLLNKNVISIATIHLDENWLLYNKKDEKSFSKAKKLFFYLRRKAFSNLDGVISLSRDQTNRLHKLFPEKQITFIPHGVNNFDEYAHVQKSKNFLITLVGSNYRDKKTFYTIVDYAMKNRTNWKFNLIGVSSEWKEEAKKYSNVIVHPYLSENEYFKVLQTSQVHLLPVEFATANNSLLESHSLGVPSVATNCSGIRDYALDSTFLFNSVEESIQILNSIDALSKNDYMQLRKKTKDEAKSFYWETIAHKIEYFYEQVYQNKSK
jgi:glycosyltransferase involved in cell wall biosynthesis